MRNLLAAAIAATAALTLPACSGGDDEAGGPVDTAIPQFASDQESNQGVIGRGDIARTPGAEGVNNLILDGVNFSLSEGACLSTGLDIEGIQGYQAALDELEGSLDVNMDPEGGTADATIIVDGETREFQDMTAELVNGIWYLESTRGLAGDEGLDTETEDGDVAPVPEAMVVFNCPENEAGDDDAGAEEG